MAASQIEEETRWHVQLKSTCNNLQKMIDNLDHKDDQPLLRISKAIKQFSRITNATKKQRKIQNKTEIKLIGQLSPLKYHWESAGVSCGK
jgi:hypothetical protein